MAQEIIYLTAEGYKKIKDELEHMRSVERPAISAAIAEARDKGDLSENAEYDAAREAQGLLEMRIAKLEDTHLQQPLCLTGGIVLRILRKVALVARFGDRRRNRRTLDGTHVLEFVLDFLVALRCQINNLLCHNPITLRNLPPEAGNSKNRIKRKK